MRGRAHREIRAWPNVDSDKKRIFVSSHGFSTWRIKGGTTMPDPSSSDPREKLRPVVPKLIDLTEKVLFGDVWERPALSKRDRSLITVATLIALNRSEQLRGHLERALNNGVTKSEIIEVITHLAFYSGWPTAMSAAP